MNIVRIHFFACEIFFILTAENEGTWNKKDNRWHWLVFSLVHTTSLRYTVATQCCNIDKKKSHNTALQQYRYYLYTLFRVRNYIYKPESNCCDSFQQCCNTESDLFSNISVLRLQNNCTCFKAENQKTLTNSPQALMVAIHFYTAWCQHNSNFEVW